MSDKKSKKKRFILTPKFRVSFPDIKEKNEMSNKYRIVMLFDKSTDLSEMMAMAKASRVEKWPKGLPKGFLNPFKKVDDMDKDDRYDGMEDGMIVVTASASYRPGVVDAMRNQIDVEDLDESLYGGCYARAAVRTYSYDRAGNRGVAFGLDAIQIIKDGEPLGSRVNAEDAFADVEDEDTVEDTFDDGNTDDGFSL